MKQKKWILVAALATLIAGLLVYFGFFYGKLKVAHPVPQKMINQFSSLFYQNLSLKYPKNYSVQDYSPAFKVLTVSKDSERRLEIFYPSDFGSRAEPADLKEKFSIKSDDYRVWLFYPEGDTQTQSELHQIYNSIKVK